MKEVREKEKERGSKRERERERGREGKRERGAEVGTINSSVGSLELMETDPKRIGSFFRRRKKRPNVENVDSDFFAKCLPWTLFRIFFQTIHFR